MMQASSVTKPPCLRPGNLVAIATPAERNRYDEERHRTEFLITLFTRNGAHFERHEEHHVQRWFSTHEITDAAKDSGFELLSIHDDYSAKLADPASLRETWVLRRIA